MDKRTSLKVFSLLLLIAYLAGFAWLGTKALRSFSAESEFVGVIKNLPSRLHEPMNFYEVENLISTIEALASGNGSSQGLTASPDLEHYLGGKLFDVSALIAQLRDSRLRVAQSQLVELSVRVSEAHNKSQTKLILLFIVGLIGCYAMASLVAHLYGKTKLIEHTMDGKSVEPEQIEPSSPLAVAIQNTSHIESVKTGHDYVLELSGDDLVSVTDANYPLIEATICEMVSNSIVHGGRASAVREAVGKPSTLKVFVGVVKTDKDWQITVADDGEGIDEMETMQHAISKHLVTENTIKGLETGHGVKLILLEGFSNVKPNKGGVLKSDCLASVREAVQAAGGVVSLRNRPTVFCEFKLKVPA